MLMMQFPWNHPGMMWMPPFPAFPPHSTPFKPSTASPVQPNNWMMPHSNQFHTPNVYSPTSQWSEMILVFPDGTTQRTLRNQKPSPSNKSPQTAGDTS